LGLGTRFDVLAAAMLGRASTSLAIAITALGCGTARMPDAAPSAAPDAGAVVEESVALDCVVTIAYPPSTNDPELDVLSYDVAGKLVRQERSFADGLYSVREWTWSEDGRSAQREWFDGSRVIEHDARGRATLATTFDAEGAPTWQEAVTYDERGVLVSRLVTRLSDDTPWLSTTYDSDGYSILQSRSVSLVDPDQVSSVKYKFEPQQDDVKMVQSHDIDGDGVIDFKTAKLLTAEGVVERAVDAAGQLIDFDYEGDCESIARAWPIGDPFFVDM